MNPTFEDAGVPQPTQTIYKRSVACTDSIFAGQESIFKFTAEGNRVYTCFYDLASAFDSVEFSVLLDTIIVSCWNERKLLANHKGLVH